LYLQFLLDLDRTQQPVQSHQVDRCRYSCHPNALYILLSPRHCFHPSSLCLPTRDFPYALRSTGVSLTYFSSHVGLSASRFINPVAMAAISWKYYIVFCVINAALFVFVGFFLPETKGYSLGRWQLLLTMKLLSGMRSQFS
jgi:Sugar (and other) transporter